MTASDARWSVLPGQNSRDRRQGQRAEVLWRGDYLVIEPVAPRAWERCYLVDISRTPTRGCSSGRRS